jgi:hypothetical protein
MEVRMESLKNEGEVAPGIEAVVDDIIDLEEYAKAGKRPPLSKGYRIKVNGDPFVLHDPNPTGRAILTVDCARSASTSTSISANPASRSSRRSPAIRRRVDHGTSSSVRAAAAG